MIPVRSSETAMQTFTDIRQTGFESLDIVQLHLPDGEEKRPWRYKLEKGFIQEALQYLAEAGMELEVLPFKFEQEDLFELLNMGIRRFAVDEPSVFVERLKRYVE